MVCEIFNLNSQAEAYILLVIATFVRISIDISI